jgi:putative heme iron utilization protein
VDLRPLLLLSDLAVHTRNLTADPRAGLLFDAAADLAEPLTGARVSVLGTAEPVQDARALERYVRRQPSAQMYRGFGDFRLWRFTPARGQLVAGFGQIAWVEGADLRADPAAAADIAGAEEGLLERLNGEHGALIELLGRRATLRSGWRLTGLDPDGVDIRSGQDVARLEFAEPVAGADAIKPALEALAGSR